MPADSRPPRPSRPREQLPITLFEGVVLAVRGTGALLRDLSGAEMSRYRYLQLIST